MPRTIPTRRTIYRQRYSFCHVTWNLNRPILVAHIDELRTFRNRQRVLTSQRMWARQPRSQRSLTRMREWKHNSTTDYVVFISGSEFGRSRRAELCQRKVSEWHICILISEPFGYSSGIHVLKTEFREGLCELRMGCHSFDILANCMLSYLIVLFVVSPSLSLVACHMAVRFSSLVSETNETITRISQWLMPLTCQPARQAR